MLGKLFKHEWKNTYKIGLLMVLIMIGVTVFGCASFFTPLWVNGFQNSFTGKLTPIDILGIVFLIFYVISIIGVTYGILIYLGVRFYKSMYTDEGYLTHTLPVTSHHLLLIKGM